MTLESRSRSCFASACLALGAGFLPLACGGGGGGSGGIAPGFLAPQLTLISPADGALITSDSTMLLLGYGGDQLDLAAFVVELDGLPQPGFVLANGVASGLLTQLADGPHSWKATLTNSQGDGAMLLGNFTVDLGAPNPHPLLWFVPADASGDFWGVSVSSAGDVDGDGCEDFLGGARYSDKFGFNSGFASLFSGATGQLLHQEAGQAVDDNFGISVAGTGDVDGDGVPDWIAGASGNDAAGANAGSVRVLSGTDGMLLWEFTGNSPGDQFGISCSGAGDVDGDGFNDLIVGANFDDLTGSFAGSAEVFSGATGQDLWFFPGNAATDQLGISVDGAGDVDADGFDDLICGAFGEDHNGPSSGSARVFSGSTGSLLFRLDGLQADDHLGNQVCGMGDLDGDGFDDFAVGAYEADAQGSNSGMVRVYSGQLASVLFDVLGNSFDDQLGFSVANGRDLDGDGVHDLLAGAPYDVDGNGGKGQLMAYSGANGSELFRVMGQPQGNTLFGLSSASGDIDGNGTSDLIVGAPWEPSAGALSGAVRVFSGGGVLPLTLSTTQVSLSAGGKLSLALDGGRTRAAQRFQISLELADGSLWYGPSGSFDKLGRARLALELPQSAHILDPQVVLLRWQDAAGWCSGPRALELRR